MSLAVKIAQPESYAGKLARQLMAQRRWSEAADAFRLATKDDPHCVQWWLSLAECLLRQGERTEAIGALVAATDLDIDNGPIHNKLGCLEKHPRLAEDAFRAAVTADPECALYRANLAVSLFKQWRFDEAEGCLRRAVRLDPNDVTYAIDLGHMLMELERFSGAKSVFRRAATLHPHDPALGGRAWQLYDEQRYEEAQALFSHREQSHWDRDIAWAYQGFGLALRKLGENRPAVAAFRAAISLSPELAVFHRNLGDVLSQANRAKPAAAAYERARQLGHVDTGHEPQGWTIGFRAQD